MPIDLLLLILVLIAGGYLAWSIGANDVANAMGTSVGSGALTLRQAVYAAAILEFTGAFFFGSHVSATMQSGIVNTSLFGDDYHILVCGMLSALLAAGIWLQIASYYGWPVSTTHSIVGAIAGFGIVAGGIEGVYWENISFIVVSWIISPLFGGVLSFIIFNFLRHQIFFSKSPFAVAKKMMPWLAGLMVAILSAITLFQWLEDVVAIPLVLAVVVLLGAAAAIVAHFWIQDFVPDTTVEGISPLSSEYIAVEKIFGYLQIMSACLMAFAHGANDVSNAIGPLIAALSALEFQKIVEVAPIPAWTLALGGCGIVIGLATWGWRVIDTIGKKITELTPSRGFAAEFGAATTILVASRLALPISTTHTLVGAVLGVGLARGLEALDMSTTRDIVISWIVTVPAGALIAMAFFKGFTYLLNF